MVFPATMWILLAVSLLLCSIGFRRFVWFMSVGYGVSAAGIGLTLLLISLIKNSCNAVYAVLCLLLVVYGVRLGGFLLWRELKNEKYRAKLSEVGGNMQPPMFVMVVMWLCCGALYVTQTAGPIYRLLNDSVASTPAAAYIGAVISLAGVIIEALADRQKTAQKELHPELPAMEGLYKLCRCPNYFGEMLFWTGIFTSGFGIYSGWQWAIALFGYVAIEYVMIAGAKRVEGRHIKNYGKLDVYNKYADSTPILFPFIPLYHMTSPEKMAKEAAKKASGKK